MRYVEWEPTYFEIIEDFGYSLAEDEKAAKTLSQLLRQPQRLENPEQWLTSMISGNNALIIGPCISADEIEGELRRKDGNDRQVVATVGEGTKNILKADIVPEIVVTDLDGFPDHDLQSSRKGSVAIIHAHGDNISSLETWTPKFKARVIPTCQCAPINEVYNWGGFTDGDRAFCIFKHFGAEKISLLGFDFRKLCGSKSVDNAIKKKKLQWAEKIIEQLSRQ